MPLGTPSKGVCRVFNTFPCPPAGVDRIFWAPALLRVQVAEPTGRGQLTGREREVVDALCRPLRDGGPDASPATNQQIADEVFLSLDAVKGHLRTIYVKLGLESLRQNEKRAELAARGLRGELTPPPPKARRPRHRAVLVPTLAAILLAPLAALGLAGVVSTTPIGGEDEPTDPPRQITKDEPPQRADPGRSSPKTEAPDLFAKAEHGLLPVGFVTEAVSDLPAETVDGGDADEPKTEIPGNAPARLKHAVERSQPQPQPQMPAPPPVEQQAGAPATTRCVTHVHRTVTRRVVFVRVPRRVRVRVAHRHVRIERRTFLHPHRRVWVDRKGRRHVRRWLHPHVRTVRHPYVHWHLRWRRKRVKVRRIERRVHTRDHLHCG